MSSCENTETTACSVYPLRAYFSAANAEISSNTQILKANYSKCSTGTLPNIAFVLGSQIKIIHKIKTGRSLFGHLLYPQKCTYYSWCVAGNISVGYD